MINIKSPKTAYEVLEVIKQMENILGEGEWNYEKTLREFHHAVKSVAYSLGHTAPTGVISACTRGIGIPTVESFILYVQSPSFRVDIKVRCSYVLSNKCTINTGLQFEKFIEDLNGYDKYLKIPLDDENIADFRKNKIIIGKCDNVEDIERKLISALKRRGLKAYKYNRDGFNIVIKKQRSNK
ncbi:hypothetical protein ABOONEI_2703 [Aciduliprofundum boonei T469]|nr:hypothetical protein ABOONEI_2703 [Aciduliprofundum boonei T469]